MNEYRRQQLAAAALIDSGDYTAEQVAEVFGWIKPKHKPPERAAPERSGATGHNKALTPRRKCGIIKAIKRYVRRWKRKQEGKNMKIERYILSYEWREKIESCTHSGTVDRKIEDLNEFFEDIEKARERAAELEKDVKIITEGNKTVTTYNANFKLIDRK